MALSLAALQQLKPVTVPDPREGIMNMAALKSQMLGDQLKGLQVQQAQGELQSNQVAAEQLQQMKEIVAKHGGDIEKALPEINQINPTAGAAMLKTFTDIKKMQSDINAPVEVSPGASLFDRLTGKAIFTAPKPQELIRLTPGEGIMNPGDTKPFYTQPFKPENKSFEEQMADSWLKENPGKTLTDYGAFQNEERIRIAQANRVDPEQVVNYMENGKPQVGILNKRTHNIEPLKTPSGQTAGAVVSAQNRPPSEGERTAFRFYERMKAASDDLARVESEINKLGLGGQAWLKLAPNFLQTDAGQRYQQAQRAFTEARLRKDSGAAIPESEFENDRRMYFVQPGDSKATIDQKNKARATALEAIKHSAGRAYEETYGESPTAAPTDVNKAIDDALDAILGKKKP